MWLFYQTAAQMKAFHSQQSVLKDRISKMASDFNHTLLQSGPKIHCYSKTFQEELLPCHPDWSASIQQCSLVDCNPQLSCVAARNSHLKWCSTGSEINTELLPQTHNSLTDISIMSGRYSADRHTMVTKCFQVNCMWVQGHFSHARCSGHSIL